jgi:gamma-glutamyltranspeptidase/glutathione hydrolase
VRGAIAGGHPLTAEAGAEVLREGGNAVDACIAACLASWAAESPLTGAGGGGFMLIHRARDRSTRVLDFFVSMPGLGAKAMTAAEMESVDVSFAGEEVTQKFLIGAASCAVPGTVAGLELAHRHYGSLPWRMLFEPAIELARRGFELTRPQAYLHAILDLIIRRSDEGRRIYSGADGDRLVAGDRLAMPELATTLELLAERGGAELYRGDLGRALVRAVQEQGGSITDGDLASYRAIRRRPVLVHYRGHDFRSNPPPSTGGVLIGYALRLLDRATGADAGSAEAISLLVGVMREQARARDRRFAAQLYRGGLARRLYEEEALEGAWSRVQAGERVVPEPAPAGGTTHISVVDGAGNAASLSVSTGSGSGVVVPGTGVQLNNMLGEFDLHVGAGPRAGTRLTSMMAPSLVLRDGAARLVVGSAGSLRLRGAILQVILNVIGHGLTVEEAIERPRVHVEDPHVHCEGGHDAETLDRLEGMGHDVVRWRRRNLYFGGAQAVEVREDGSLAAAGDPRRGGHGIVVE